MDPLRYHDVPLILVSSYNHFMKIFILLFASLLSFSHAQTSRNLKCFYSHSLMEINFQTWHVLALEKHVEYKQQGKPASATIIEVFDDSHCIQVEADARIFSIIEELYNDQKKTMPMPLSSPVLSPMSLYYNGASEPILKLPMDNPISSIDTMGVPFKLSGRMVHPKLIELTIKSSVYAATKTFNINELMYCLNKNSSRRVVIPGPASQTDASDAPVVIHESNVKLGKPRGTMNFSTIRK